MSKNEYSGLYSTTYFGLNCAIDNTTYRQMADCDTLKSSNDLRLLKTCNLLISKGKGKATYYVSGKELITQPPLVSTQPQELNTPPQELSTPPQELRTPPRVLITPPQIILPDEIQSALKTIGKRVNDAEILKSLILRICSIKPFKSTELAEIIGKREDYLKRKFLGELIADRKLKYLYPEMINHPAQAYLTNNRG